MDEPEEAYTIIELPLSQIGGISRQDLYHAATEMEAPGEARGEAAAFLAVLLRRNHELPRKIIAKFLGICTKDIKVHTIHSYVMQKVAELCCDKDLLVNYLWGFVNFHD